MNEMTKDERKDFRRAARQTIRKARKGGRITRLQRGRLLIALLSDQNVDDAADLCVAKAVECGVITEQDIASGREISWTKVEADIDIEKIMQFLMLILPMFI